MAYMNQERKAKIASEVKKILKKYGVKGTMAVRHHMTLVLNIKSGPIDFINNFNDTVGSRPGGFRGGSPAEKSVQVNPHWYHEHFSGEAKEFLSEVVSAMNHGNHDRSDIQTDYHDVGWYIDINVGQWNKPYIVESK